MKKEIRFDAYGIIHREDLEGDTDKVIENIKEFPKRVKEVYPLTEYIQRSHRFAICIITHYEESDEYILECYRWETDAEERLREHDTMKRKQTEAARKAKTALAQEQREKTLYETLKKKFEKP
jgi:type III secretory pathway component EscV